MVQSSASQPTVADAKLGGELLHSRVRQVTSHTVV
jgi:hypothetical protein